jgi:hypothetical protein
MMAASDARDERPALGTLVLPGVEYLPIELFED